MELVAIWERGTASLIPPFSLHCGSFRSYVPSSRMATTVHFLQTRNLSSPSKRYTYTGAQGSSATAAAASLNDFRLLLPFFLDFERWLWPANSCLVVILHLRPLTFLGGGGHHHSRHSPLP